MLPAVNRQSNVLQNLRKRENRLRVAAVLCPKLLSIGTTPVSHTDKVKMALIDHTLLMVGVIQIDLTVKVKILATEIIMEIATDHIKAIKAAKAVRAVPIIKGAKAVRVVPIIKGAKAARVVPIIRAVKAVRAVPTTKAAKAVRAVLTTKAEPALKAAVIEETRVVRAIIKMADLLSKIGTIAPVEAITDFPITIPASILKVAIIEDKVKDRTVSAVLNQ
jgi:hypothetical protein